MSYTADDSWRTLINQVLEGKPANPRDMSTLEKLGLQSVTKMAFPIVTNPVRKMGYKFMFAEAWWILSGRRDVASIEAYGNIGRFSDDGYQFDGAYGPQIMEQMRYVVDTLANDEDSRQAVITIWRPNPRPSSDIPCTVSLQLIIRDNKINCIATMRSSDLWLGWVYDVFNFSMVSLYVALRINDRAGTDLKLGNLHLTAGSQHLYQKHYIIASEARYARERDIIYLPAISTSDFANPADLISWLAWAKYHVNDTQHNTHNIWKEGLQKLSGLYASRK